MKKTQTGIKYKVRNQLCLYLQIKGLTDALETPGVCSNYRVDLCSKTYKCVQEFKSGNALFTFPNTPVKCAGAPQKIMYITDYNLRQMGKRENAQIHYHSSLAVLFGVKKYADALWEVVKEKDINVNLRSNLIEVKPDSKEAVFQNLDEPDKTIVSKRKSCVTFESHLTISQNFRLKNMKCFMLHLQCHLLTF